METDTIRLEPWQIFILVACFGFRRRLDGRRLVTTVFFQVARKSAKSTLVAAVALYHLTVEREPGGQVVCAASTGQQAGIVFNIAQHMVRRSLWLRAQGLQVFANSIVCDATGGTMKPINAESSTQDGLSPSFISLDESHAQTFELRDVLVSAMGARPDGAIRCPTTADYDLTSMGYALRSTATKILDGVIESDHSSVVLYELDEADAWDDATTWIKAAPMIGITPALDYVKRYCTDAQQTPGMEAEFQTMQPLAALGERMAVDGYQQEQVSKLARAIENVAVPKEQKSAALEHACVVAVQGRARFLAEVARVLDEVIATRRAQ